MNRAPSETSRRNGAMGTALASIGRANLALGEQWLELSAWAFSHGHRANLAAFEAFCERPLFAAQAVAVTGVAAVMRDAGDNPRSLQRNITGRGSRPRRCLVRQSRQGTP